MEINVEREKLEPPDKHELRSRARVDDLEVDVFNERVFGEKCSTMACGMGV